MNIGALVPPPNILINRPQKISNKGNLYKVQITHTNPSDNTAKNFEVWATKEAVQQHLGGYGQTISGNPKDYELKKFAKQMYEKQLRSTNGILEHKGILVTTDSVIHGDPRLWPHVISHPEVKV